MKKKTIIIAASTFIIGIVLSGAVASYAVNGNNTGMMNMYAIHGDTSHSASSMSMDEMTTDLKGKTGDDFDKAFVAEMITHHQGAIDMANLALTNAKHQEVKDLAETIITAQTSEITQMKNWQTQWGYTSNSTMNNHSMMGM
jgi:uncharacterized protein (DUF305 family)